MRIGINMSLDRWNLRQAQCVWASVCLITEKLLTWSSWNLVEGWSVGQRGAIRFWGQIRITRHIHKLTSCFVKIARYKCWKRHLQVRQHLVCFLQSELWATLTAYNTSSLCCSHINTWRHRWWVNNNNNNNLDHERSTCTSQTNS